MGGKNKQRTKGNVRVSSLKHLRWKLSVVSTKNPRCLLTLNSDNPPWFTFGFHINKWRLRFSPMPSRLAAAGLRRFLAGRAEWSRASWASAPRPRLSWVMCQLFTARRTSTVWLMRTSGWSWGNSPRKMLSPDWKWVSENIAGGKRKEDEGPRWGF